jgi:hypothetical protein
MLTKTEAIKEFLGKQTNASPIADVYKYELEVQVNVRKGSGEIVTGTTNVGKKWRGFQDKDTGETWKHFRIPWGANSEPKFTDSPLNFSLERYAEAIGFTGWNWVGRCSEWVGFDFDSIINHKEGLTDDELREIFNRIRAIPYVTIYTSTSNLGYHIYINIHNSHSINTHTQHAAYARAILSKLSGLCGFSLTDKVDVCGGILWVWKDTACGFKLLKEATETLDGHTIIDWEEHEGKIKPRGKRRTTLNKHDHSWDVINSSIRRISLDNVHRQLLEFLDKKDGLWWWDADHWMLVTHTSLLAQAHKELNYVGVFQTISEGKDELDQNCFAFPLSNGSWVVRRHTPGCEEHSSWRVDKSGWTYTFLNRVPTVEVAASLGDGVEGKQGVYYFKRLHQALESLGRLGIELEVHEIFLGRQAQIKELSPGKIFIAWERIEGDPDQEGWRANKKWWEQVITYSTPPADAFPADGLVRNVVSQGAAAGWFVRSREQWVSRARADIIDTLVSQGVPRPQVPHIMGESILQHWELTNKPFEPEYPGNRQWNKSAAQFSVDPRPGEHPSWNKIFNHIGQGLDSAVKENDWCQENGILNGSQYLLLWIAALIQFPVEPLPYLFLYGPQNSGKSILHEALRLLLLNGKGLCRADNALVSTSQFNGELEGAIICVVEETNLRKNKQAYEKIKDWVTSKTISIRKLYADSYDSINSTHWIHCANNPSFCPVFPGDTRIVVSYVNMPSNPVPKFTFLNQLKDEVPAILQTLLETEIPESNERLRIPCISTSEKEVQMELSETPLQTFINNYCYKIKGHRIRLNDFCEEFYDHIPSGDKPYWTGRRICRELPHEVLRGKMGQKNETYLGNITFDKDAEPCEEYIRVKDRLKK